MTDAASSYAISGLASPANLMTLSRIVLSPLLFLLILGAEATLGTSWLIFVLGWLFGLSDFFDGRLARASNSVSRWGAFLDPLADKIVVLGAAFSFVAVSRYALLPVVLIALREVAMSVVRVRFSMQGLAIPARQSAKWKAIVQGLALVMAAMPTLRDQQLIVDVALWVAVIFTIVTGLQYVFDGRSITRETGHR